MRSSLAITLALAACVHAPSEDLPLPPVPPPQPPKAASATVAPPVASVAREYQQAARQETVAVTDPSVTPDFVRSVHRADLDARHALQTLERQKLRPSQAALDKARASVKALSDVLQTRP